MKKLGLATALVLTLAFGAGSVFAQNNSNTSGTSAGGTMTAKHSRRHHRRAMRRHRRHHRKAMKAANANS